MSPRSYVSLLIGVILPVIERFHESDISPLSETLLVVALIIDPVSDPLLLIIGIFQIVIFDPTSRYSLLIRPNLSLVYPPSLGDQKSLVSI